LPLLGRKERGPVDVFKVSGQDEGIIVFDHMSLDLPVSQIIGLLLKTSKI